MQSLRSMIQSPSALFAFEAAARHLSFTRAAEELNVTQAAVSYAVRQLETALDVVLFHRRHRRITLTEAGERFYNDVSIGLAHIRRSAEAITRARRDRHVTLSVSTAFAAYWMVPRLAEFRAVHPEIDIRLQTTDKDLDLAAEGTSLGVRRGSGEWPGYEAMFLAPEAIVPVASPAHLARTGPVSEPADLLGRSLIHLEEPFRVRPTWTDWFAGHGLAWTDRGEGLRLNDYALVLQAAIAGEGVALGWRHLVERLIAQGFLVEALDAPYSEVKGFYLIWPADRPVTPETEQVRDWIAAAVG
jgi:DNA-binding transcriptional LysR family regulator